MGRLRDGVRLFFVFFILDPPLLFVRFLEYLFVFLFGEISLDSVDSIVNCCKLVLPALNS